jgi:hypothetical protein
VNAGDFEFDHAPGIPAPLPPGEYLLWQGRPRWQALAVRAFHVRKVAAYFALMVGCRFMYLESGAASGTAAALKGTLPALALAFAGLGILLLLAFLSARSAIFSITSRRVLIRHGIALPLTLNVPFREIDAAAVMRYRDGSGNVVLTPASGARVGYLLNWPYMRPGRYAHPEPMLRALATVDDAAAVLAGALAASAAGAVPRGRAPNIAITAASKAPEVLTA